MSSQRSFNLVVLALAIGIVQFASQVDSFNIEDCSEKANNAELKSVTISSCPDATGESCTLKKGETASIDVDFKAVQNFEQANVKIFGVLGPVKIPFSLEPSNACGNYGFDCPVAAGTKESLKISLPVLRTYPSLSLKVELRLLNEHNAPIVCIRFPAKISK